MRQSLAHAEGVAQAVLDRLRPLTKRIEVAGSIRRRRPDVKDIELVAAPLDASAGFLGDTKPAVEDLRAAAAKLGRVVKGGDRYMQIADVLGSGLALDLFMVHQPAEWGVIYAVRTGPAEFSRMLMQRINLRGWKCEDGRVVDQNGKHVPCPEERDFFAAADYAYVSPELRTW